MSPARDHADLEPRLAALEQRLAEVEARLEQLAGGAQAEAAQPAAAADGAGASAAVAPALKITPELVRVIRLVQEGRGDEAERELRRLPEAELASQPGVVALVAAALCVQRGDYANGLKALGRARSLTGDARLLRVMELVEAQMSS